MVVAEKNFRELFPTNSIIYMVDYTPGKKKLHMRVLDINVSRPAFKELVSGLNDLLCKIYDRDNRDINMSYDSTESHIEITYHTVKPTEKFDIYSS